MARYLLFSSCFVLSLTVSLVAASGYDACLESGNSGHEVVEMTVDRIQSSCIFPDDKMFLRRLSYVESNDGLHPETYREGYYGGIWQMDEDMFKATQSSMAGYFMVHYFQEVNAYFGIDWMSVKWEDLTMPLYSGLGARLYIEYEARGVAIPRSIEEQGDFYVKYYRPEASAEDYVELSYELEKGCDTNNGPDMVFVLDGSGSIGSKDFKKILDFAKDVVNGYDIGPDKTRIGLIKYSTRSEREFDLNTYDNKEDVLKAIDKIKYRGGGTNTHLALDEMTYVSFTTENGARPREQGHPRIGIVLTDGKSNQPSLTIMSAMHAHAADITMFAIGVGSSVDLTELEVIASEPTCMHLFLLSGFDEIEALTSQIEKSTCEAPIILSPSNDTISGTVPPNSDQNCQVKVPVEGATVKIFSSSGGVKFYLARNNYPNSAYYENMIVCTSDNPGIVYLPQPPTEDSEGIIYCSIEGNNQTESDIEIGIKPGDNDHCSTASCQNGGTCTDHGSSYTCACTEAFTGQHCENAIDPCGSHTCVHGSCLASSHKEYTCVCDVGFTKKKKVPTATLR